MIRTASLGLSWEDKGNYYIATLPFIPGYPVGNNTVTVEKASIVDDGWWGADPDGWAFMMTIHVNDGETAFLATYTWGPDMEPFPTAEDAMAWVDALEPEDISQVLEDCDYTPILDGDDWSYETASKKRLKMKVNATASREPRYATRRTADLNLDWHKQPGGFYLAYLPSLPGYPSNPYEPNSVIVDTVDYEIVNDEGVYDPDGGGWSFRMLLHANSDEMVCLYPYTITNSEEPFATAQEAMQFVDNLTLEDISQTLDDLDYTPILDENGDWITASLQASRKPRHATRRKRTWA